MKFFQVTTVVTVFISFNLPTAIVAEPNYLCYFVTSSGKTVDLTASLCSKGKKNPSQNSIYSDENSKKERNLREAYKRQAYNRQQFWKKRSFCKNSIKIC